MLRRWACAFVLAAAACGCTLFTDFSGIADGNPDAASGGSSGADTRPRYPRLALVETENPKDFELYDHMQAAARVDLNVMGIYPGWEETHGPIKTVVAGVKAINPNTKLFVIYGADQFRTYSADDAYAEVSAKLDAENWWLYENGTSGWGVLAPGTTDAYLANTTLFTPKDADGKTFIDWYAGWSYKTWIEDRSLDGILLDRVDFEPRAAADYDRNGTTDDPADPLVRQWYRAGFRAYFDALAAISPSTLRLATIGWLADSDASSTELDGVLHGGLLGDLIGQSYSKENDGWPAMMNYYHEAMAFAIEPKLVIFHMVGSLSDYKTLRYGLASCLMDDGYFAFNVTGESWGLEWFDEYDADLGYPTMAPPEVAWSNGVWRRDFDNGIVLVNPKGNGPQTVDLGGTFRHLSGTQDPIVNDGSETQSVTLADRDGIILLE